MRKLQLMLLVTAFLSFNCNQNNGSNGIEDDEKSHMQEAATQTCKCLSAFTENLSSQTQKLLIKASKAKEMKIVLQEEIMAMEDKDEQLKIITEMQSISRLSKDGETKDCLEKIKKKYKLKDDEEKQTALLKELRISEGCEVIAAMMKMGFGEKTEKNSSDDANSVDNAKYKNAGNDYCECMNTASEDLPAELRNIFVKAGKGNRINEAEMTKISEGFRDEVTATFNKCLTQVNTKYELQPSDKNFAKAVNENEGCDIVKGIRQIKAQRQEDKDDGN